MRKTADADYDEFLEFLEKKVPAFVELMNLYLRAGLRDQVAISDGVYQASAPDASPEERKRRYGLIASVLFAQTGKKPSAPIVPELEKATMREQRRAFGQRLRAAREEKGLTQGALAQQSGVSQSELSTLEMGKCRPTRRTLERLSRALGVVAAALWLGGQLPSPVNSRKQSR